MFLALDRHIIHQFSNAGITSKAIKKQSRKCIACGLTFMGEEKVHLHHADGNHDNWDKKNLVAIHESCHDYVHMSNRGKVVAIHEPCQSEPSTSKSASQEYRELDARKRARPDLNERGGR